MGKDTILNIVAIECPAEEEERFNKWYNEVHIPMLLPYQGLKKAGRYRLAGESNDNARYLTIYEYDTMEALQGFSTSPELAAAMEEMQGSWKDGVLTIKWMAAYEPIKTWEK